MRIGVLASHPIQYQAPWFRELAKQSDLLVFFSHFPSAADQGRAGFGVPFDWDVDLLSGYEYRLLKNVSAKPRVDHALGCDTPEIAQFIRDGNFDAFIVSGWHLRSYRQAIRACRRFKVPLLVRGDSHLRTPRSPLKRMAMEFTHRKRISQFDGFLYVGQRNREYLQHFGATQDKLFFCPHSVDNDWFRERAEACRVRKVQTRTAWGVGSSEFVALFVGKFIHQKRPVDLLRAIQLAASRQATPRMCAVFVGAGELEGELRELAERESLSACFPGFKNQSELPDCYAAADVLVLPSDSETWGLVVNEAMACGLPALVSDAVGCAPDLITEGETGFTFPVRNARALSERLQQIAELLRCGRDFGPGLRNKMHTYSIAAAVSATLASVSSVTRVRYPNAKAPNR
jgi:glycosyltransferase involved in cell wall biosynthesis